jgi:transcriptional regulator with XRE-family HTH domain
LKLEDSVKLVKKDGAIISVMSLILTSFARSAILQRVSNFYVEFGERLKEAREKAGLTQQQLAAQAGLPRTSVTNIERGGQKIALHQMVIFAAALGLEPAALLPDGEPDLEDLVAETARGTLPTKSDERQFAVSVLRNNQRARHGKAGGDR